MMLSNRANIACRAKSHIGGFGCLEIRMHMLIALNTRRRVGNVQKSPKLSQVRCGRKGAVPTLRNGQERAGLLGNTDLLRAHLELADDLDGHLAPLPGGISCSVYVAEGAVAHLLKNLPSFKTRVLGQLALCLTFLGNNALQNLRINSLTLLGGFLLLPLIGCSVCCGSGLCCDVAVVAPSSDRIITVGSSCMMQRLVIHYRL
ncbi:uncharacterized protein M421DRAFT_376779 [Didymella exigua CBS 183.55]|uniref:Uncharacterized protein n=1 Tax=Didymella exigua CBS 183.55 TaxID=1150837 RepID=A0A6A5RT64_9PLEO|nr:uncharacterized protein M421DRAFT_376779 [Didymella exigua CBS 183.55]KAF1930560.1 hypothetical protein M421DRAFT_376779 [Didymella exigua CBS 183.55]